MVKRGIKGFRRKTNRLIRRRGNHPPSDSIGYRKDIPTIWSEPKWWDCRECQVYRDIDNGGFNEREAQTLANQLQRESFLSRLHNQEQHVFIADQLIVMFILIL